MVSSIAIFGGSFDPPHVGHVEICRYVLKNDLADKVIVVPCWVHPFSKTLAGYDDRLAMCRRAFGSLPNVEVSEIERELGGKSHTIRTVDAIASRYPAAKLRLVIGTDLSQEMESWRDADELRRKVNVITVPRGPNGPIPDVSATEIRKKASAGQSVADMVPAGVEEYITSHKLYLPQPLLTKEGS